MQLQYFLLDHVLLEAVELLFTVPIVNHGDYEDCDARVCGPSYCVRGGTLLACKEGLQFKMHFVASEQSCLVWLI